MMMKTYCSLGADCENQISQQTHYLLLGYDVRISAQKIYSQQIRQAELRKIKIVENSQISYFFESLSDDGSSIKTLMVTSGALNQSQYEDKIQCSSSNNGQEAVQIQEKSILKTVQVKLEVPMDIEENNLLSPQKVKGQNGVKIQFSTQNSNKTYHPRDRIEQQLILFQPSKQIKNNLFSINNCTKSRSINFQNILANQLPLGSIQQKPTLFRGNLNEKTLKIQENINQTTPDLNERQTINSLKYEIQQLTNQKSFLINKVQSLQFFKSFQIINIVSSFKKLKQSFQLEQNKYLDHCYSITKNIQSVQKIYHRDQNILHFLYSVKQFAEVSLQIFDNLSNHINQFQSQGFSKNQKQNQNISPEILIQTQQSDQSLKSQQISQGKKVSPKKKVKQQSSDDEYRPPENRYITRRIAQKQSSKPKIPTNKEPSKIKNSKQYFQGRQITAQQKLSKKKVIEIKKYNKEKQQTQEQKRKREQQPQLFCNNIKNENNHIVKTNEKKQNDKKDDESQKISQKYFIYRMKNYLDRLKFKGNNIENRFQRVDNMTRKLYPYRIKFSKISYELDLSKISICMEDFASQDWNYLQRLILDKCQIDSKGWKVLIKNAANFKNLIILSLVSNKIQHVKCQDLEKLVSLRTVFFGNSGDQLSNDSKFQISRYQNKNPHKAIIYF